MTKKYKIALVSNSSWTLYNFRQNIIKHLQSKGNKVYAIAPNDEYSAKLAQIAEYLPYTLNTKGTNPLNELAAIKSLKKVYESVKPDIIFHYTIKPNIWGSIAAKQCKIPSIAITTGLGYVFNHKNLVANVAKRLYKKALKHPKQVWFLNKEDEKEFIKNKLVDCKKCLVIPGEGIDMNHFKAEDKEAEKDFSFLFLGRLLEDKGLRILIASTQLLANKFPKTKFKTKILGFIDNNNPTAITEEELASWTKLDLIEYLGVTDDVRVAINNASCIVLPSFYKEGVPRSLMEAASMGKPLITTDNVGCREVIIDGRNGFMCQPKDVQDLADKMEKMLLLTDDQRAEMGENGRQLMKEKFDQNIVFKFYEEAIANFIN